MSREVITKHFQELDAVEQAELLDELRCITKPIGEDALPTPAQQTELDARLKAYRAGELETRSYEEVRKNLRNSLRR